MPRTARMILLMLAASLAGACASGGATSESDNIPSREVLTREQIDKARATNAFEAVQRLRSNWLRLRGTTQMPGSVQVRENPVLVYIDGQKLGEIETLRAIEVAAVRYIRYYTPAYASSRWGFNHGGGVIYVSTRPADQ